MTRPSVFPSSGTSVWCIKFGIARGTTCTFLADVSHSRPFSLAVPTSIIYSRPFQYSERKCGGQLAHKHNRPSGSRYQRQSRREHRLDRRGLHRRPPARLPTRSCLHSTVLPEIDPEAFIEEG